MSLVLGCADSLIAHSIYADFLQDEGVDVSFFRLFLQMKRNVYNNSSFKENTGDGYGIIHTFYERIDSPLMYERIRIGGDGFGNGIEVEQTLGDGGLEWEQYIR